MRSIFVERRIELSGIVGEPKLRAAFIQYQLEWITRPQGSYNQSVFHELYISYTAIVALTTPSGGIGTTHPQVESTFVRAVQLYLLVTTIHRVFLGPDYEFLQRLRFSQGRKAI